MGRQKLMLPIDGRPMLLRVLQAASAWPTVVVAGEEIANVLEPSWKLIINAAPDRGMTHSLALAHARIAAAEPIAVLLGDLPDITAARITCVIASYDDAYDVVVPRYGERFGHPVIFGAQARRKIAELPDGDTLSRLRDDAGLRRRIIDIPDDGTLTDIDTPADYYERTRQTSDSS